MEETGCGDREVTLVLCDDVFIRRYNHLHRGEDAATDVLSYPLQEPEEQDVPAVPQLGDIMISVESAARQAARAGREVLTEVMILAAHGLKHLQGYDHQSEEAWRIFTTAQQRILELRSKRGTEDPS